ncbi:MAG: DUF3570 domain-containing protein [Rubrivivax sp.]|nr:DUF3570 domain-containing protein [Rubrivivax sp.]MDH5340971.1 DUF3570 domain-containing protein [Rubrivivax sp.]
MAATDWLRRAARVLGGLLALHPAGPAGAAEVPADDAEAMIHVYDGGGVRAVGPALLVRKSLADRVSASASYYVDAVSNASIDVVTTASPFKETRNEVGLGLDYAVRDALVTASFSRSTEPDYTASSLGLDVAQDVFGGMTSVSMGFSRGRDDVGKVGDPGFADQATHWQYRVGATQVLTPTWLMSANLEAIADEGLLGSPYRAARVFGAAVPERLPRTRSSRALKLRAIGAVGEVSSVRAEYRYYWDTWALRGHTVEFGGARRLGDGWLAEATLRLHSQNSALFYSDNATAETEYITRNRQLSAFRDWGVGAKLSTDVPHLPATWKLRATMGYEFKRFDFQDFTDLRTGTLYAHNAHLLQINVSAPF